MRVREIIERVWDRRFGRLLWLCLVFICGCAEQDESPSGGGTPLPRTSQGEPVTTSSLSNCRSGSDLVRNDNKRVRLIGMYRKSLTAIKMRGDRIFRGFVHIELEGRARDAVASAGDGPAIVELVGKRSDEEVEQFADRRVRVHGRLVLDPYKKIREEKVDYATVIFGPPHLEEPGDLSLQPGS